MVRVPLHRDLAYGADMIDSTVPAALLPYCSEPANLKQGNTLQLLRDGVEAMPAMLEAISEAQHTIYVEMYHFASDDTGWRFVDALVERATAGLEVAVLYDGFGSLGTSPELWQRLEEAGVRLFEYNPIGLFKPLRGWFARDHRKVLVLDHVTAFVGGLNLANAWAPPEWGGSGWRDTAVRIVGPCARDLAQLFRSEWDKAGRLSELRPVPESIPAPPGRALCGVFGTSLRRRQQRKSVQEVYLHALRAARQRICLTTAYFIPARAIQHAIRDARKRGVDVVLLLAGTSDIWLAKYAGRRLYRRLLSWGVEVYEWTDRVLHAKTMSVDGCWASVGSFNLDPFSARYNLEVTVATLDRDTARALERMFEEDVRRSQRIHISDWKRRSWIERGLELLCYPFRFWM